MSVRHALLGLLAQKPGHGYELHAAFEAIVGGDSLWNLKLPQVYTTLERLQQAGWVECASDLGEGDEPSRRLYALTPAGCTALQQWFDSGVETGHEKDELYVKLMVALVSGQGDPARILQTQRAFLFRQLHNATRQRNELDPQTELAQILFLDKVIMHLEADLRWLDLTESRLEEIRRQPLPEPEIKRRGRPKKKSS